MSFVIDSISSWSSGDTSYFLSFQSNTRLDKQAARSDSFYRMPQWERRAMFSSSTLTPTTMKEIQERSGLPFPTHCETFDNMLPREDGTLLECEHSWIWPEDRQSRDHVNREKRVRVPKLIFAQFSVIEKSRWENFGLGNPHFFNKRRILKIKSNVVTKGESSPLRHSILFDRRGNWATDVLSPHRHQLNLFDIIVGEVGIQTQDD